jgi:hypothetical protein
MKRFKKLKLGALVLVVLIGIAAAGMRYYVEEKVYHKDWLGRVDNRACGARLQLSREYKMVDYGWLYGEPDGWVLHVEPAGDEREPESIADVLKIPAGFTLTTGPSHEGELGLITNADGSCSVVASLSPKVASYRKEPWIVRLG